MEAGKLNERIQLIGQATTQNGFGESVVADADTLTVWASVRQQGSAEKQRNGITTTDDTFAIRMRYRESIDTTMKIVYRGRTLAISSVMPGGRMNREYIDIFATEST